jgi:hypothetical protein
MFGQLLPNKNKNTTVLHSDLAIPKLGVTEPPNYTKLSRKIIQRKDNLTNLSPYNPVVREISTDFKSFHITGKIVLSLTVTIISYIKVRGIKYIGV